MDVGKNSTPAIRSALGWRLRAASMALRASLARQAISDGEALGLATVSIRAAVSPKSFRYAIGPAPLGRSVIDFSLRSMSSHCLGGSFSSSSSVTKTIERLPCEMDSVRLTRRFSATFCSILRVTCCSILSAVTPFQGVTMAEVRVGNTGSLRLGIEM